MPMEYNRTASEPLHEEVLVAVLISRSPKEVRTYLHVQVREETAKLSHVRQFLYDYLRAGKAWNAPLDVEEAMASLTDAPVRLLLDSGSGVSACSPDFDPHAKTLTESSVRARSATGQVTKSLGKKTVNFDINGIAAGVNMEVLKISKPIVSASKMVRSGRKIVLDEHNSFIEDKKTVKRIPVELTRGDVLEISAYMSSTSHGLPKKQVLICPNEVVEAEDPGHKELDESMPEPDAAPRGVAVPETPSDKDREAHKLTHLPTQPWCSVCVRAKGIDERHLRRQAGERAEAQGVDHMPVIQFDYAYLSSVNEKGEQVRMRTILDTSTGYGTACVIAVKGGGGKCAISSAVSFLKELGYTRFRCRTDPEPAIKARINNSRESCESGCSGGLAKSSARRNSSVATRRRRSLWVNRW